MSRAVDDKIRGAFRDRYGADPEIRVRAPGRVNLIGEHIDYVGLGVLPVALEQAVHLAIRPREDGVVRIASTDPSFPAVEFDAGPTIDPGPAGDWGNYVRAAVQDVARRQGRNAGWDGLAHSEVPVAAGLSSSSALVVASGLATAATLGLRPDGLEFAEAMAAAEQYVGTRGGGMDQAVCVAGTTGCALRVDFEPLRVAEVPIPASWRFVVSDSGVQAYKSGAARETYNRLRRDAEASLAALGDLVDESENGFADLLRWRSADEVRRLVDEAEARLPEALAASFRHVATEGARVGLAERALRADDMETFGRLMDASHASLRDELGVSCPELDALVDAARVGGAIGARLTGAGMGGCIVALTESDDVDRLLAELPRSFVVVPSAGASVHAIEGRGR